MTDNFLSNDNYYNKGGLNSKPKEPRPSPPKGQLLDNEYEIIIDDADVSECDFLWKEKLPKKVCNNGNLDGNCNSNPNCYFKQLKRKERAINNIEDIYRTDDSGDYDFVKWKILDLIREVKGVN